MDELCEVGCLCRFIKKPNQKTCFGILPVPLACPWRLRETIMWKVRRLRESNLHVNKIFKISCDRTAHSHYCVRCNFLTRFLRKKEAKIRNSTVLGFFGIMWAPLGVCECVLKDVREFWKKENGATGRLFLLQFGNSIRILCGLFAGEQHICIKNRIKIKLQKLK